MPVVHRACACWCVNKGEGKGERGQGNGKREKGKGKRGQETRTPPIEKKEKSFPQNDSLKDEIDSFVKCIKNNKKAVVDASDGLNALTYALKISNLIKK